MTQQSQTIRVNFAKPMPLFPLSGVVLLPHAWLPLHVFEPRYRQMIESVIDSSGQIAMAVFEGDRWRQEYHGAPPIRPVVCVGQIVQHEKLFDGRYNILLQGVCRATVREERHTTIDRLYREAVLRPMGPHEIEEESLPGVRERLRKLFTAAPLTQLTAAQGIAGCLKTEDAPLAALLELISVSIITDNELKYRLLAEPDPVHRADMIERELISLRTLLLRAHHQVDTTAPKGVNWN